MAKRQAACEVQKRREQGGRLWLSYYNQILYKKGIITEQERNKMALKIGEWKGSSQ
ncbi:MAG: hypothetical protein HFF44_06450 [Lawsonibacter sp.]|nr:hypothetical protein [Lawsonibacter sp.]